MDQLFQKLSKPFPAEAYKDVKIGRGFTTIDAYHIVAVSYTHLRAHET